MKDRNKGFTLIELLVVVAIIGVLSSVVLASLSSARSKGNDSAIKANLSNIRAQAEILRDDNGDYHEVCGTSGATQDSTVAAAIAEANTRNGSGSVTCNSAASGWAVASDLDGDGAFCVDADGAARDKIPGGSEYADVSEAITGTSCN